MGAAKSCRGYSERGGGEEDNEKEQNVQIGRDERHGNVGRVKKVAGLGCLRTRGEEGAVQGEVVDY